MHTDRAKSSCVKEVRWWCPERGYLQTMTAGDNQANGRVESEINQFKRRLRVLRTSGVRIEFWSCVRHVMKARGRSQSLRFGLPQLEMLPIFAVKVKHCCVGRLL